MKRNIFAVCDLEAAYAHNFMEYMNEKKSIPFEIQAFTNVESLLDYCREQPIEILLISDKAMCAQVKELEVSKLIILSEGVHSPRLDQYPSVYKYQSSDNVIREVMACYGEEKLARQETAILKKPMEILGVYSPLGRVLKTSFALTLGQLLAKKRAVMYLDLEEYAGFEGLLHKTFDHNLSDLLYFVRQENVSLIHKMGSMVQSVNNLDFIPPALSPMDIRNTSYEEWTRLLDELSRNSTYEMLILDIGHGVDELYQLLDQCRIIFMPVLSDMISEAKISQFENLLRIWDCGQILAKIKKVKLPYHSSQIQGPEYVEQLLWGELGDYVRNIIREEKL